MICMDAQTQAETHSTLQKGKEFVPASLVLLWVSGQVLSLYRREEKSRAIIWSYCALITKVRLHFRFSHPFTDMETIVPSQRFKIHSFGHQNNVTELTF